MPAKSKRSRSKSSRTRHARNRKRAIACKPVTIMPGSPPAVDQNLVEIDSKGCVEWATSDGSNDWVVTFKNNETPFKHFHFHAGRPKSGNPNANAKKGHYYEYSVQTGGGLLLDPQVIIH